MTSSKKIIAERMYYGRNPFFFRDSEFQKTAVRNSNILECFELVNRFYSSLEGNETEYKMNIKDCYALKLADSIIDRISSGGALIDKSGSFSDKFYNSIAESLPADELIKDNELVVIYLKQMMNIMKSCGMVKIEKRKAVLDDNVSVKDKLYFKLLESFWNETNWCDIFPSSPEAAEKLFENRGIFLDFLEKFYTKVSVEDFANDFFEMTDIASSSDFFMISFLDFYLLTWFRHFGIIDYNINTNTELVNIALNNYGREIIKILD